MTLALIHNQNDLDHFLNYSRPTLLNFIFAIVVVWRPPKIVDPITSWRKIKFKKWMGILNLKNIESTKHLFERHNKETVYWIQINNSYI